MRACACVKVYVHVHVHAVSILPLHILLGLWPVSSLSSPMCAGNTTLEENEMHHRQSALQRLILFSASDPTPPPTESRSAICCYCSYSHRAGRLELFSPLRAEGTLEVVETANMLTCTQADWTRSSKYLSHWLNPIGWSQQASPRTSWIYDKPKWQSSMVKI